MKAVALLAVSALVCACAVTPPEGPNVVPLENSGFELGPVAGMNCAPKWGCSMHADPTSFRFVVDEGVVYEGRNSLRIEPVGKEHWALAVKVLSDARLRGARMRFSIAVRVEGVTGNGAGPIYIAQNGFGSIIDSRKQLRKGTRDWERLAIEFQVPAAMGLFEVGAILDGAGKVWVDDAQLEVLEPAPHGKKPV